MIASRHILAFLLVLAPLAAVAQQPPPPPPGPPGGGPGQQGQRDTRRWWNRGDTAWVDRVFDRISSRLELDDVQRDAYDQIVSVYRDELREVAKEYNAIYQEAMESGAEMRPEDWRDAVADLPNPRDLIRAAVEDVEPILSPGQLESLNTWRERRRSREEAMSTYRRIVEEMPTALDLDEEQQAEFDAMIDEQRTAMRERFQSMRGKFEELRQAQEAGDTARVRELEAQVENAFPRLEDVLPTFFERVDQMLREDQKGALAEFREEIMPAAAPDGRRDSGVDLRTLFRAARRVDLDKEQRAALKSLERESTRASRALSRKDKAGQSRVVEETRAKLIELFDAEQRSDFERALQRIGRTRGRR